MHDRVAHLVTLLRRRPALVRIVRLLVLGISRKRIAAELGTSVHTVNWHLSALYRDIPGLTALQLVRLVAQEPALRTVLEERVSESSETTPSSPPQCK